MLICKAGALTSLYKAKRNLPVFKPDVLQLYFVETRIARCYKKEVKLLALCISLQTQFEECMMSDGVRTDISRRMSKDWPSQVKILQLRESEDTQDDMGARKGKGGY